MELWKDIEGFEGKYQISNFGRVVGKVRSKGGDRQSKVFKSNRKAPFKYITKEILPYTEGKGYQRVNLMYWNGVKSYGLIHALVAKAFISNPDNLDQINHKDCDKTNNHFNNLEWVSCRRNIQHSIEFNLHNWGKLTKEQVLDIRDKYSNNQSSSLDLAAKYNVTRATIYKIVNRETWKWLE